MSYSVIRKKSTYGPELSLYSGASRAAALAAASKARALLRSKGYRIPVVTRTTAAKRKNPKHIPLETWGAEYVKSLASKARRTLATSPRNKTARKDLAECMRTAKRMGVRANPAKRKNGMWGTKRWGTGNTWTIESSDSGGYIASLYAQSPAKAMAIKSDVQSIDGSRLERDENFLYAVVDNLEGAVDELRQAGYKVSVGV